MNQPAHGLSDAQIRKGLRINIFAAGIGIFWFATINGLPLIMILEALGATGVMIGMISMLNQAAMLIQIPAALIADRLTYRKPFWMSTSGLARLIWIIPALLLFLPLSKLTIAGVALITVGISALLTQSSSPCWWSWMADMIPDERRNRFWSLRQGTCMTGMLITFALCGWFFDLFPAGAQTGFGIFLFAAAIFGTVEILLYYNVAEPAVRKVPKGIPIRHRILAPLKNRNFRNFTLLLAVWLFGVGLVGPFAMVYLRQEFDTPYTGLAVIQISIQLGSVIAAFGSVALIRRFGIRNFGILTTALAPLTSIAWFFISTAPAAYGLPQYLILITLNSLFNGSVFASLGVYQVNMLTAIVPRNGRTTAMAMHWSIAGIFSALAPIIAGAIKDGLAGCKIALTLSGDVNCSFYHVLLILHAGLIWSIALPLARSIDRDTDVRLGKTLTHIFIINPLRMTRDFYGFNGAVLSAIGSKTRKTIIQSATKTRRTIRKIMRDSSHHNLPPEV
ncbi:MAG: MFS transporter [Kiritimatiellales bacterium]